MIISPSTIAEPRKTHVFETLEVLLNLKDKFYNLQDPH